MKKITLLLFALLSAWQIQSQVSSYAFSQTAGTYTEITGGTVLGTATTTTSFDSTNWTLADGTIPFNFNFNGTVFTGCVVNSNGFLTFGAVSPDTYTSSPLSGTLAYSGAVSAWGRDLCSVFIAGVITGEARYEVVGTAPNRTFVVQYKNWRPVYSSSTTIVPYINFQIRLEETTNAIKIVYGSNGVAVGTATTASTAQVGLRGSSASDFNNRLNPTTLNFNTSTPGTANNSSQAFSYASGSTQRLPNEGLTYAWVIPSCFAPTGLNTTALTTTSAAINWNAVPTAVAGYEYVLSTTNAAPVGAGTANATTSVALTALSPNTTYYYWVRSNCSAGDFSTWSASTFFTGYCQPSSTSALTYINNFSTTGGIAAANITNNLSGFTVGGYQDNYATSNVTSFATGSLNFSYSLVGGTTGFAVYVDWNNNLAFEASERMYTSNAYLGDGTYTGTIAVPAGQALGEYRMRIRTDYNNTNPDPCAVSFNRTEAEDYKFTVAAAPLDAMDFNNIQSVTDGTTSTSTTLTVAVNTPVTAFAQGFEAGVTEAAGAGIAVESWIGYSATNTDPSTWPTTAWSAAAYVDNQANNDNFSAVLNLPVGTYYVASRWRLNGALYTFGGFNGTWNGTTNNNIQVIVTPLANDDCAGALPLTVGANFGASPITGNIFGATTTPGVVPSCQANYGYDVWYTVVVPASGNLVLETQTTATNNMTDSVIAAYTGACGALTQVGCDDDGGLVAPNANMSILTLTALTPGTLLHVAVWKWQSTVAPTATTGGFMLSAYDCPSATPAPTGAAAQSFCSPATVANLVAVGTAVNWYTTPTGGTAMLSTDALVSGTIYYASQTLTCESFSRLAVTATVVSTNLAVTPVNAAICEGAIVTIAATGSYQMPTAGKIGAGTTGSTTTTPYRSWYGGQKTQAVYTAAELTAKGLVSGSLISSLGHTSISGTPLAMNNFTLNAGLVPAGTVINGTSNFIVGASNNVYTNASYTPATGTGNLDYALASPIVWDGTSDLLVETCFNNNNSGGSSTNSLNIEVSNVAANLFIYRSQDNTVDVCSNTSAVSTSTARPNLRISYTGPNVTWTPITGLYSDTAATIAYVAGTSSPMVYAKPSGTTVYTASTTNGTCTSTATSTITVNSVAAPTAAAAQSFCNAATVANLAATGTGTIVWYSTATAGTALASTASIVSGTYYAAASSGVCESLIRTAVNATVVSMTPLVATPASATICTGTILPISVTGAGLSAAAKVGAGTFGSSNTTPFKAYYGGQKTQALYTSAELSALGLVAGTQISSIGWVSVSGTPIVQNNFTVSAGLVPSSTQINSTSGFIAGASTTVLPATAYTAPTGTGNIDFPIATPIVWDGNSSLLVETCFNNNNSGGSSINSLNIEVSTVSANLMTYRSQDNTIDVCSNTTTVSTSTDRPNLRMSFTSPSVNWSPVTELYSDAAATVSYIAGTNATTVYARPTGNVTYVAASSTGACSVSASSVITVNQLTAPAFAAIASICQGSTAPALEGTSTNTITGTWSPSTIDTSVAGTTTYTFTPDAGQCAATATADITINVPATPAFAAIASICQGSTAPAFEAASTNGITGTWSPSTIDTSVAGTTTYTFTPDAGLCAVTATLDVTIDAQTIPAFAAIASICQGSTAPALEASSTNGIAGTWSPSTIDTSVAGTTTYTFTPDAGLCATTATLDVTIDTTAAPTGAALQQACATTTLADLAVNGTNLIWYDANTLGNVLPSTTPVVEGITYYASQTVSACESIARLAVTGDTCLATDTFTDVDFNFYPNPVSDVLNVSYSNMISKVEVISVLGQLIKSQTINNRIGQIDMSNLPSGTYLVRVSSGNEIKTIKVIKR